MRLLPTLVLACLLALLAPATPLPSAGADPADPSRPAPSSEPQTSDGVRGRLVDPLPPSAPRRARVTVRERWHPAPGIEATSWDETTSRGPVRMHLLSIAWRKRGIAFSYLSRREVRQPARVGQLAPEGGAVAAVNGDFYDIHGTMAPLGVGRTPGRGLIHGRRAGWNSAFYMNRAGKPRIGTVTVQAVIRQRPDLVVGTVNAAKVEPQGIGLYTEQWGPAAGTMVTDGPQKRLRMLLVRGGRVVKTSRTLMRGARFHGQMIIGRGDGADRLADFAVGDRLTLTSRIVGDPALVITGSEQVLDDGRVRARDDSELHPRTAVGVDLDGRRVLLLVVDGRQDFSRGYTLVELARRLRSLGAEDALNLDGGGSSTMIARRAGRLSLVNSPSDGRQRRVANALGIRYRAPR